MRVSTIARRVVKSWTSKQRFSHHASTGDFRGHHRRAADGAEAASADVDGRWQPGSIRQVAARGYNLLLDQFASFETVAERIAIFKTEVEKRAAPSIRSMSASRAPIMWRRTRPTRKPRWNAAGSAAPPGDGFEPAGRYQEQIEYHGVLRYREASEESALYGTPDEIARKLESCAASVSNMFCSMAAVWCSTRQTTTSAASRVR